MSVCVKDSKITALHEIIVELMKSSHFFLIISSFIFCAYSLFLFVEREDNFPCFMMIEKNIKTFSLMSYNCRYSYENWLFQYTSYSSHAIEV